MAVVVTLEVFSGRPDPEWILTAAQQAEFSRRIASAPEAAAASGNDALGYRGFQVRISDPGAPSMEFHVYGGRISGGQQSREDRGRSLERWLLDSARPVVGAGLATYVKGEISRKP